MRAPETVRPGILWLASYPKSGNTWLRLQLANYFGEGDEPHDINKPGVEDGIASSRTLVDEHLALDSAELDDDEVMRLRPEVYRDFASQLCERAWLKVHDAQARLDDGHSLFPADASAGAVYVVRNPLDVAVSHAYAFEDGPERLDRSITVLCDPGASIGGAARMQVRQILRDWSAHVASWVEQTEIPVLTVRYEDMLADTADVLKAVVGFARPDLAIAEDRIAASIAGTAFDTLQAMEAEHGFRESFPGQRRFFRSGRAGDWREHLTGEQVTRIVDCHGPTMARFGYLDARGEPVDAALAAVGGRSE